MDQVWTFDRSVELAAENRIYAPKFAAGGLFLWNGTKCLRPQ
jgi:hypothetical protein